MAEHDNQRRFPRHECDVPMEGRLQTRPGQAPGALRCRALNASEGGLMIESQTPLTVGQRLVLFLRGGDRSRALDAEAEVVWVTSESGVHRAGLRFIRRREEFVV